VTAAASRDIVWVSVNTPEVPMTRSRRTFMKHAAVGAAGGMLGSSLPQTASSQDRTAGANARVRVGLIGCGGQGTSDLRNALRLGPCLAS